MFTPTKPNYRNKAITLKISMTFFTEPENSILKLMWSTKYPEEPKQS
jgi:hypothetical protein